MFRSTDNLGFPLLPARSFWRRDVIETMTADLIANDNAVLGIPARVRALAALAQAAADAAARGIS